MIDNPELQDLYRTVADVLDGYNKTHDVQVVYVDFEARVPDYSYSGSVVCREYPESIIDYHYRDLRDDDFDWYSPDARPWPTPAARRRSAPTARVASYPISGMSSIATTGLSSTLTIRFGKGGWYGWS